MGNWELLLDFEVENREQLRDIMREIKNHFADIIRQVEINEVYQMDKFTQMAIEYPELLDDYELKNKKTSAKKVSDTKETTEELSEDGAQKATEEDIYY